MTLITFNNKDLLRDVRTKVLNPMVTATNLNTLGVVQNKGDISSISRRLGTIEPIVKNNSTNLSALNQFAQAVAQQVTLAYDKSQVNYGEKQITFTTLGGIEKTLDLSPMFIDPVIANIDVSLDSDPNTTWGVHQLNFKGNMNLNVRQIDAPGGRFSIADVQVPYLRGKLSDGEEADVKQIKFTGNVGTSKFENGTLTIEIPKGGEGTGKGFFLNPNPPVQGQNFFLADTQALAETARDAYFTSNPTVLATYDANVLKCILVEWKSGVDVLLQFQSRHNNTWVNPFNFTFSSFLISRHSLDELNDGSRVKTLETDTITGVTNIGEGVDVFKEKQGRNLKLRKLKSKSPDLSISIDTTSDSEISFTTNQYWKGYYASTSAASTAIPVSERITNKTTIVSLNSSSEAAIFIWDSANWKEQDVAGHVDITTDGQNWEGLKALKPGKNVTFTSKETGGKKFHEVDVVSTLCARLKGQEDKNITCIEVANKYAEISGDVLKLPVISAINTTDGDLGQIKNIKQGDNIDFAVDSATGVLTIKATAQSPASTVKAQVGSSDEKTLTKIVDPTSFSTLTDAGVLTLQGLNLVDTSGTTQGYIKSLKSGSNTTLSMSDGVVTISSIGGGGTGGSIEASVGGGAAVPITKIADPSTFSKVENGVYIPAMLEWKIGSSSGGFISSLDNGNNIGFSLDSGTGKLTVQSWLNVKLPEETRYKGIEKIKSNNPFHTIDKNELLLHSIDAKSDSDLGFIKSIKAGSNVTFAMGTGDDKGILTINSTGGGGGSGPGSINVAIGTDTNTQVATTIHSVSKYSTFSNGILNIHAIDCNDGTGDLGLVKTLKAGPNVTFSKGTSGDEDGVLTITATGGSGSIEAAFGDDTTYSPITKIRSTNTYSEVKNGELIIKSVNAVDTADKSLGVIKMLKASSNIAFEMGSGTSEGVLTITSAAGMKGKIKVGDKADQLLPIESITVTTDPGLSRMVKDETTGLYDMVLDTRAFVAGASTLDELKSKFPIESNAYRHGYTGNDKAVYFAHVTGSESGSPSSEWKLHNYYGMADEVKSSSSRFPEQTTETSSAYDPSDIKNGYRYFSQEHSSGFFPEAADREFGILENITASQKRRSQMFYGMESGGVWFRHMDHLTTAGADTDFKGWQQIAGVSEEYHSILTIPSFKITTANNEIDGVKALPWMVMQDPKCNVSVDGADTTKFVVNKNGTYDITVCFHITSAGADTDTKPVNYTFQLKKTVDGTVVQTIEKKDVVIPTSGVAKGLYPPVRVTFTNVKVVTRTSDSFKVTAKVDRASTLIAKVPYLDSFKNYLVVQPSSSNTKQGIVIAEGFRRAFGGFSSKPGYEVHVEGTSAGAANVRVYGALVNDKLQN